MRCIRVMKFVLSCFLVYAYADQAETENYEELIQKLETMCRETIDDIFVKAHASIAKQEDMITGSWLDRQKIKDIQNNMSNASVELSFDLIAQKLITEKIQDYLQLKIRDEADKMFESKDISIDQVKQFFYLSELVCKLSKGNNCHDMIRAIRYENFPCIQNLRTHKKVQKQAKKEQRRALCDSIALGTQQRL
jgi:hypothetical protein